MCFYKPSFLFSLDSELTDSKLAEKLFLESISHPQPPESETSIDDKKRVRWKDREPSVVTVTNVSGGLEEDEYYTDSDDEYETEEEEEVEWEEEDDDEEEAGQLPVSNQCSRPKVIRFSHTGAVQASPSEVSSSTVVCALL